MIENVSLTLKFSKSELKNCNYPLFDMDTIEFESEYWYSTVFVYSSTVILFPSNNSKIS